MKKFTNYLIALALTAFTLTSCEDVPSPFGEIVKPDSGDVIVVEPSGSGTEADPYNVAGVLEYISGLGADVQSTNEVYIKGIITEVQDIDITGTFGNATYYISDDADGKANKFYIYRGFGLGGKKFNEGATAIKAGDKVVIKSKVVNYKGNTPETVSNNCIIVELNGTKDSGSGGNDTPTETIGSKDAPITVAKALELINALADNGETAEAYVKGIISKVQSYSDQYKSITYYISDDGKEANELQIYSGKNVGGADFSSKDELAAGDVVVVKGKLKKYVNSKTGAITLEMNQPNEIITITKGSGGGGGTDTYGTKDSPLTIAKAIEMINALDNGGKSDKKAYVKGKVAKITTKAEDIGSKYTDINYLISEDGSETNTITIYRGKNLDNTDFTAADQLAVGDEVIVFGELYKYVDKNGGVTPELAQGNYLVSRVAGGGGEQGGNSETGADGSTIVTVAEFLAAEVSNDVWYQLTGTIKNLKDNDLYGNFDLEDSSGSVYVYGVLSTKGGEKKKFQDLVTQYGIANGKTITIVGNRGYYQKDDKIEVMNAYFISVK